MVGTVKDWKRHQVRLGDGESEEEKKEGVRRKGTGERLTGSELMSRGDISVL